MNKSFDYTLYNTFIVEDINIYADLSKKSLKNNRELLDDINSHYGTNLAIPNNIYYAFENIDNIEDLKTYSISENLLSSKDYDYLSIFSEDFKVKGFEEGILNFEENVLSYNINNIEFKKYEVFANTMKITNDIEPIIFENYSCLMNNGPLNCLLAYFLFYWATIGLIGGCATIIFCVAAWIGFVVAAGFVVAECGAGMEE